MSVLYGFMGFVLLSFFYVNLSYYAIHVFFMCQSMLVRKVAEYYISPKNIRTDLKVCTSPRGESRQTHPPVLANRTHFVRLIAYVLTTRI